VAWVGVTGVAHPAGRDSLTNIRTRPAHAPRHVGTVTAIVVGNRRGGGKTHDLAPLLRYLELAMRDTVLLRRALARDLATSRDAQAKAVRYTALVKKDYASQGEADQSITQAGSSTVATEADTAVLEQTQINLQWTTIAAPISGRTGPRVGTGHNGRRSMATSSGATTATGGEPGSVGPPGASSGSG
jgi:hypothetical protein